MKNLKRALSFALASVMLVGMMVVGAGAASFNDAEDIQHTEAVNSMVTLGLISGRPNGDFDPTATITRAEMAKLVCTAMNGGRDPQLDGVCQFDDVKAVNHWASGYIQYCVNMGYVNGRSATVFDPDSPITAQEAAKMMLNAIGYNSETEGFVGAGWGSKVDAVANTKGLYDDVLVLTTAKLSRDDAAQIVWNAMDATLVEYDWYPVISNGVTTIKSIAKDRDAVANGPVPTILTERFKMNYAYGYMTDVTYDEKKAEYTYTFETGADNSEFPTIKSTSAYEGSLISTTDFSDLYGQKVKVMLRSETSAKKEVVYGMYVEDDQVMFEGTVGNFEKYESGKATLDGDEYKLSGYAAAYNKLDSKIKNISTALVGDGRSTAKEFTLKLLDVNGDGKGDVFIVEPYEVGKVTFVGKETMTVQGIGSYKFEDEDIEEGLKRDDYVKVVASANTAKGRTQVTKLELVSGEVTGVRAKGEVRINGVWYTKASPTKVTECKAKAGDEYDLYVIGKKYYHNEVTASAKTLDDVVFISASQYNGDVEGAISKAYFMDGTSKVISVTEYDKTKVSEKKVPAIGLYTFEMDGSDYELTSLGDANKVGYDSFASITKASSNAFDPGTDRLSNGYVVDDDAVVIYAEMNTDGTKVVDVDFITGKTMKSWKSANKRGDSAVALADEVNGLNTAKVVLLQDDNTLPNASGDATYGYIMIKPYEVKDGGKTRLQYDLWTADGKVSVIDKDSKLGEVARDDVIKFDDLGDGYIDEVTVVTALATDGLQGAKVAIRGYNDDVLRVQFKDGSFKTYTLDDDTQYLYVNVDDHDGVAGGAIDTADEQIGSNNEGTGKYFLNAWIVVDTSDSDKPVKLVVYDVNNKLGDKELTAK